MKTIFDDQTNDAISTSVTSLREFIDNLADLQGLVNYKRTEYLNSLMEDISETFSQTNFELWKSELNNVICNYDFITTYLGVKSLSDITIFCKQDSHKLNIYINFEDKDVDVDYYNSDIDSLDAEIDNILSKLKFSIPELVAFKVSAKDGSK